jgi:Flp pilus assembly protein protease CpaA
MLQLIQQAVLLVGTATGAVTDTKTGYIYDWITYPMIFLGFVLSVMQQQWNNILIAAVLFTLLFVAYKLGKLGGGDVKMFAGIALLNPTNNYMFLATTMLFAAMSAMIFCSAYYTIKYAKKGIKVKENKKGIKKAIVFGTIIVAYLFILISTKMIGIMSGAVIFIPLVFGLIFIAFQEGITKNFFEEKIMLKEIEEEEVLAERNQEKVFELLKGSRLVGEKEKMILEKQGVKSIYALRKLPPFGPFILLGIIITLIQPEFFLLLFM